MDKKLYKVNTGYGTYEVEAKWTKYAFNNALAVLLESPTEGPFATLTVNIDSEFQCTVNEKDQTGFAFVDVNNNPWAERFIADNHLGIFTGSYGQSGWCTYPLYLFDLTKLEKIEE